MPTGTIYCSLLKVGHIATSGNHTLADGEVSVSETFATSLTPSYDAAGNMTTDGTYTYSYDAWNRLLTVQRPGITTPQTIATYRYDGLGRRVYKHVENSGDASAGGRNCEEYYYYNHNWQLLEIRNTDDKPRQQFVWGTQYIDEGICMDVDTDTSGAGYGNCTDAGSRRFFYMQDANYNVIALREAGTIVERYEYDPYGTVRVVRGWNDTAAAEDGSVAGQSLKWLDATLPSNPFLYGGYFHDWETGVDYVRNRMYNHGVWIQRDPIGTLPLPPTTVSQDLIARLEALMSRVLSRDSLPGNAPEPATIDLVGDAYVSAVRKLTDKLGPSGATTRPELLQYADGMNVYQYVAANPVNDLDASGLDRYRVGTDSSGPHAYVLVDQWEWNEKKCCWTRLPYKNRYDFHANYWYGALMVLDVVCGPGQIDKTTSMVPTGGTAETYFSQPWEDWEMENQLAKQMLNPPYYSLLFYNCIQWSRDVIRLGYGAPSPSPRSPASDVCR